MSTIKQDLLDSGYREHRSETYNLFRSTDLLYQKKVTDEKGVRYFINCWMFEKDGDIFKEDSPMFEVQFVMKDGEHCGVNPFYVDIQKAEDFFHVLWEAMDFAYDELYH